MFSFVKRWFRNRLARPIVVNLSVSYLHENERFKDKNVFVTGGTSGIGLAIAKAFLKESAKVLICARNENKIDEILSHFNHPQAVGMKLDVSDVSIISQKILEGESHLGGKIDIFVNCAGVSAYDGNINSEEMYDYICDINQKGLYFMNRAEGDYLMSRGIKHTKIINITSKAGERIGFDPYIVSKWGANAITKGIARRLAPFHINVNGIAPGRCPTNITRELQQHMNNDNVYTWGNSTQRFTMPEEVASAALYLASGSANQIVGQILVIDGGSYD